MWGKNSAVAEQVPLDQTVIPLDGTAQSLRMEEEDLLHAVLAGQAVLQVAGQQTQLVALDSRARYKTPAEGVVTHLVAVRAEPEERHRDMEITGQRRVAVAVHLLQAGNSVTVGIAAAAAAVIPPEPM